MFKPDILSVNDVIPNWLNSVSILSIIPAASAVLTVNLLFYDAGIGTSIDETSVLISICDVSFKEDFGNFRNIIYQFFVSVVSKISFTNIFDTIFFLQS